jgi:pimeloyl-ACP methyl ester carboxylesterase
MTDYDGILDVQRVHHADETVTLPGIAEDVIGVMDTLHIQNAVVVGHSMENSLRSLIHDRHQGIRRMRRPNGYNALYALRTPRVLYLIV